MASHATAPDAHQGTPSARLQCLVQLPCKRMTTCTTRWVSASDSRSVPSAARPPGTRSAASRPSVTSCCPPAASSGMKPRPLLSPRAAARRPSRSSPPAHLIPALLGGTCEAGYLLAYTETWLPAPALKYALHGSIIVLRAIRVTRQSRPHQQPRGYWEPADLGSRRQQSL